MSATPRPGHVTPRPPGYFSDLLKRTFSPIMKLRGGGDLASSSSRSSVKSSPECSPKIATASPPSELSDAGVGFASKPSFRAIIVGGGPNGLGLAHAFTMAGIDYVLLERESVIVNTDGANLSLWPHSVRIIDQLGLLDDAKKICTTVSKKFNMRADGRVRDENNMFQEIEKNHGYPWMCFHRTKLLELLYSKLPEKDTRIHTNKEVTRLDIAGHGARVHCDDGTVEEGSIIIGCDGVYSTVRRLMNDLRQESKGKEGGATPIDSDEPMKTSYNGLIGWAPIPQGILRPGAVYEVRDQGLSFHIITNAELAYFAVYQRVEKPHGDRPRHTDEDAETLAAKLQSRPITADVNFGDLWKKRGWGKMVDYQEGFLKKWYHERVVLLGDVVHKTTSNAGLGLNTGWQGMVVLTNKLRKLLEKDPNPDTASIKRVFKGYQKNRKTIAKTTMMISSIYTRILAWDNQLYKFCDFAAPSFGGDVTLLNLMASPIVKRGVTFDFVQENDHKTGKVAWKNPKKKKKEQRVVKARGGGSKRAKERARRLRF